MRGLAIVCTILMVTPQAALAEAPCFEDNGQPPSSCSCRQVGSENSRQLTVASCPKGAVLYVGLDWPVCLTGEINGAVNGIRSVHLFSMDAEKVALLKRHRGKRVWIRVEEVFQEHTAHHLRPMWAGSKR
jgi:hypothetical protein